MNEGSISWDTRGLQEEQPPVSGKNFPMLCGIELILDETDTICRLKKLTVSKKLPNLKI